MSWRAWCAFAALGLIWGLPYFFIKLALQELSPFVVAWGRITLAVVILLPVAWHRGALSTLAAHKVAVFSFAIACNSPSPLRQRGGGDPLVEIGSSARAGCLGICGALPSGAFT